MRIDSSGNVSVGTSTALGQFVSERPATAGWALAGKSAGIANEGGLFFNATNDGELVARNASGTVNVSLKSNGASYLNGGNVGIGTSSPSEKLHISQGSAFAIQMERTGASPSVCEISNSGSLLNISGNANGIAFHTGATPTETMRITAAGYAIIPNGVTLGTAAGTYNAANTLDDYEEGTWTPAFTPASGSLGSITYSIQAGSYTKVGRQVTVTGRFQTTGSVTIGTASTAMRISGLPFATGAGEAFYSAAALSYIESWTIGDAPSSAYVANNSTVIQLRIRNVGSDGPENNMTPSEFVSGADGGCSLMFSATYFTA